MGESLQGGITYLLDTNFIRYYTQRDSEHQQQAMEFWLSIRGEVESDMAEVVTSKEVIRELDVQSFYLKKEKEEEGLLSQWDKIQDFLIHIHVFPCDFPVGAEYAVQMACAYICENYREPLKDEGLNIEISGASDARIILTALQEDCAIVTANVKDFLIYILLYDDTYKIYNPLTASFIDISDELHRQIQGDTKFSALKEKVLKYIQ